MYSQIFYFLALFVGHTTAPEILSMVGEMVLTVGVPDGDRHAGIVLRTIECNAYYTGQSVLMLECLWSDGEIDRVMLDAVEVVPRKKEQKD